GLGHHAGPPGRGGRGDVPAAVGGVRTALGDPGAAGRGRLRAADGAGAGLVVGGAQRGAVPVGDGAGAAVDRPPPAGRAGTGRLAGRGRGRGGHGVLRQGDAAAAAAVRGGRRVLHA